MSHHKLDHLRNEVCGINKSLFESGLAMLTWGNASACDRGLGLVAIKPSGMDYHQICSDDMVILELKTGTVVEGKRKPSSDTPTHLHLYRAFEGVNGVVHTHSRFATAWAQLGRDLPCYGTTHADHFFGSVPTTGFLVEKEVRNDYELNTGRLIESCFIDKGISADQIPAVLVRGHGPFTWGKCLEAAFENAVALEACAQMAFEMLKVDASVQPLPEAILKKHWSRKHGPASYYGQ